MGLAQHPRLVILNTRLKLHPRHAVSEVYSDDSATVTSGVMLTLGDGSYTLGRQDDCDVIFPSDEMRVSRHHAQITREGDFYILRDQSKWGTYVNERQIKTAYQLKHDDTISLVGLGGLKFVDEMRLLPSEPVLSSQQLNVLRHLADGLQNKEIAVKLGISEQTVKSHLKTIFEKLNAKNRADAVRIAKDSHIL